MTAAPPKYFATPQAFRKWLARNAANAPELLVGFHKVKSGKPSMTWSESVDEALCFGWIDGVRKSLGKDAYTIRFSKRRPGSIWSAINIAKAKALDKEGRMAEAGLAAFAKRTARKSVVYSYEQKGMAVLTVAERRLFKSNAAAWTHFEGTPPGYRKVIMHWITTAKREETREKRLARLIDASERGKRLF
ncbi:MAG TPA: YdeI/OmpD-associated family protein [Candidatus Polarisedimenticolaceae bacterium]|nr:YdeI/OmpD-associated family protein [Candidatus Polarisedimenticolaceae bacterium]